MDAPIRDPLMFSMVGERKRRRKARADDDPRTEAGGEPSVGALEEVRGGSDNQLFTVPQPPGLGQSYFLASSIVISKLAVAPLERIKLLVQCQPELLRAGRLERPYTSGLDCFKRVVYHEGGLNLWRGNLAACCFQVPNTLLNIFIFGLIQKGLQKQDEVAPALWLTQNLLAGGIAATLSVGAVYPMDYARTRLALDIHLRKYCVRRLFKGLRDVINKTVAKDGIRGLYRGFGTCCAGTILYRTVYFGTFATLHDMMLARGVNIEVNYLGSHVGAMLVGCLLYPLDTLQRRLMLTSGKLLGRKSLRYRGPVECFEVVTYREGYKALWRGVWMHLVPGVCGTLILVVLGRARKEYYRYRGTNAKPF